MNVYEIQRLENIKQNQKLLVELNIRHLMRDRRVPPETEPRSRTKRLEAEKQPLRASPRIAAGSRPSYNDNVKISKPPSERVGRVKKRVSQDPKVGQKQSQEHTSLLSQKDAQAIQTGWTQWTPAAPAPRRDEDGTYHFLSHPSFTPNKSPEEILREGCFGGSYYRPLRSRKLGIVVELDYKDLPGQWTRGLDVSKYLTSPIYNPDVNKFKVTCGQSIEEWEAAGWINHDHDVRGWFQWYTRFFQGRRCEDDERQVSRWSKCVGERGRWRRMLLKKYVHSGVRDVFDDGAEEETAEVSPVMHQTCHHWAFELRQDALDEFWRFGK